MTLRAGLDSSAIINTAADIADETGWDQITLAAIAERLGVKTPSLYNYIDGLPDLKKRLAVYGIRELNAIITRAAIGKAKDDAVIAVINAYRRFAEERPGLYQATLRSPDHGYAAMQQAAEDLMDILMRVAGPYDLGDEYTVHEIRALRSMVHGFLALKAAGAFGNQAIDPEVTFQFMINRFLWGIHNTIENQNNGMVEVFE